MDRATLEELLGKYLAGEDLEIAMAAIEPVVLLTHKRVGDGELPLGASRLGGYPDLPPGVEWPVRQVGNDPPEPLILLAQIDLRAAPPGFGLWENGQLWFFQTVDWLSAGTFARNKGFRVLHSSVPPRSLIRTPTPEAIAEHEYPLHPIGMELHWTMYVPHGLDSDERSDEDTLDWWLHAGPPLHYLRGLPAGWWGDLRKECVNVQRERVRLERVMTGDDEIPDPPDVAEDWLHLLQLDSDDDLGWMWGDAGYLQWMIRREDLANAHFDDVTRLISSS